MTKSDIQNPAFTDEGKAREALETVRWPDGPRCPHCGNADQEKIAKGLGKAHRPGLYYCASCNGQFTVTIGTVMEDSKIPLSKWLLAMHLMGASKKGMSALQLARMLGVTYKSAWFLCHRIREAMTPKSMGPIGGTSKVVEADETFIGGKAKNRAYAEKEPKGTSKNTPSARPANQIQRISWNLTAGSGCDGVFFEVPNWPKSANASASVPSPF